VFCGGIIGSLLLCLGDRLLNDLSQRWSQPDVSRAASILTGKLGQSSFHVALEGCHVSQEMRQQIRGATPTNFEDAKETM
jgi:hypothetical protein